MFYDHNMAVNCCREFGDLKKRKEKCALIFFLVFRRDFRTVLPMYSKLAQNRSISVTLKSIVRFADYNTHTHS